MQVRPASLAPLSLLALAIALAIAGPVRPAGAYWTEEQPAAMANVMGVVWYDATGEGKYPVDGPPAPGARLSLQPDPGLPGIYANDDGAFAFSVPEGTYTVEVWWDDPELPTPTDAPRGAYYTTTRRFVAGRNPSLALGVRPVSRFPAAVDAKIEIVWPHDRAGEPRSAAEAPLANVEAYLFHADTLLPVPCSYSPRVSLVAAVGDGPPQTVADGVRRVTEVDGLRFPTWVFDDVDVSAAQRSPDPIRFSLRVGDDLAVAEQRFRSNEWLHSAAGEGEARPRDLPAASGVDCEPLPVAEVRPPEPRWEFLMRNLR